MLYHRAKITRAFGWSGRSNLERELSIQAIKRQNESPFHVAFDGWRQTAYTGTPYAHDPLGEICGLNSITSKDLENIADNIKDTQKKFHV